MILWISRLVAVAGVIFLAGCAQQPVNEIGIINQVENVPGEVVARGLGLEIYNFKYTIEPGIYNLNIWLEQADAATTKPIGLTSLNTFSLRTQTDSGNLVVGISDPATTSAEKGNFWRVATSHHVNSDEGVASSSTGYALIANPFDELGGVLIRSTDDQISISLNEELTLATWAGGEPVQDTDGKIVQARKVSLKMKVEAGELAD